MSNPQINPQEMTLREIKEVTKHFGEDSFGDVLKHVNEELTERGVDVIAYLMFVQKRKVSPSFSLDDAYDLPMSEFEAAAASVDPTRGKPRAKKR